MEEQDIEELLNIFKNKQFEFKQFLSGVLTFFEEHPMLNQKEHPIIHSTKSRMKDVEHLKDKLNRKKAKGKIITSDSLFSEITDLIGIRVLHLYQEQFKEIHKAIMQKVDDGDWKFYEAPTALTWDPESKDFFENLGIKTEVRDTYYTSIHYIVEPNNPKAFVRCEIQVRTLFEEIWGEIDHTINYPHPTESIACREQLRVLTKLVSTGTRLADSIFKSQEEFLTKNDPAPRIRVK